MCVICESIHFVQKVSRCHQGEASRVRGIISVEVATEVIKLLSNMTKVIFVLQLTLVCIFYDFQF